MQNNNHQTQPKSPNSLNQQGKPKQAVILYSITPQMIQQAEKVINKDEVFLPQQTYLEAKEKNKKVWEKFYKNHKSNFFKNRTYLQRQIKEITYFESRFSVTKPAIFIQLGCGVGNTLFPLLKQYPFFHFRGCDISANAINIINEQLKHYPQEKQKVRVQVCDLVKDQIPFEKEGDLVSMIFVLSAIVPEKHQQVIRKVASWMKPGSFFYFRDYGRYDFGEINMSNKGNRKLKDHFYMKNDGVCVYYFDQHQLEQMCMKAGLVKISGSPHCRLLQNRKKGLKMHRVWVQCRFYKPPIDQFFLQKIKEQEQINKQKEKQQEEEKKQKEQIVQKEGQNKVEEYENKE